jgi:hypothetical protein
MEAGLPRDLKEYKVFIASPGNLQPERTEFRDVIEEYNKHEARPRGLEFVAVGWEDTFPGVGRPQTIINAEIQRSKRATTSSCCSGIVGARGRSLQRTQHSRLEARKNIT